MKDLRRRLHELLEPAEEGDHASRALDGLIVLLIVVDITSFVITSSRPDAPGAALLKMVEVAILLAFTFEYSLRLWVAAEDKRYVGFRGRLRYLVTPLAIVDLLAVLPFLSLFGFAFPFQLTAVRVFRLLKLFRYFEAGGILGRTIWRVRRELAVVTVSLFMGILSSALVMHTLEKEANEKINTIADALWWSVVTLTTVGYGEVVPVTTPGRVVASFLMVFGIAMFAIPAGLLGASFTREATILSERRRARSERRRREHELEREERMIEVALETHTTCPHCGERFKRSKAPDAPRR